MRPVGSILRGSAEPLACRFDVALLDLDGVVYIGSDAVQHAAESLEAARQYGMRLGFVTNNAARPPADVARHLTELGIEAQPGEVVNSAQAAAHYLSDRLEPGARVLVVGTTGLTEALSERGLTPVTEVGDGVAAVVQGYSPTLSWHQLAEGAVAIRAGVPWVATNLDATVPSPRGPLPGNGSMVAALRHATGATPIVTGKPEPTMHREMVTRTSAVNPLVVGDRLDTDIAGANAAGCPSLLVLTGVTSARDALAAPGSQRPTYVAQDLRGLLVAHPQPAADAGVATCGSWQAVVRNDGVHVSERAEGGRADGSADHELDALRALCAAWWSVADDGGAAPDVVAADGAAADILEQLKIRGR
jgi:glycerol 3-phosphatase-2